MQITGAVKSHGHSYIVSLIPGECYATLPMLRFDIHTIVHKQYNWGSVSLEVTSQGKYHAPRSREMYKQIYNIQQERKRKGGRVKTTKSKPRRLLSEYNLRLTN